MPVTVPGTARKATQMSEVAAASRIEAPKGSTKARTSRKPRLQTMAMSTWAVVAFTGTGQER